MDIAVCSLFGKSAIMAVVWEPQDIDAEIPNIDAFHVIDGIQDFLTESTVQKTPRHTALTYSNFHLKPKVSSMFSPKFAFCCQ